ncbi:MAG: tetratricopeptide repeat protein [Bacteroidia bacterium]|nr:tetratricopeptide repeat protein [Bacteroidia bacterium]
MKKIVLLTVALVMGAGLPLMAQKAKRTSAWSAMNEYRRSNDPDYLNKAKQNIDEASVHPDTKDDATTWLYVGDVYIAMYQREYNAALAQIKDVTDNGKKQAMAYITTPAGNLMTATDAYLKARKLDLKMANMDAIMKGLSDCNFRVQNYGIAMYGQKKYTDAYPAFDRAVSIGSAMNKVDSNMMSNAAVSAYNAQMYTEAATYYKKLTEIKYGKGNTWMMLGRVYLDQKDSATYKTTIEEGLKIYPQDPDLLTESVNIKMRAGKSVEAIEQLNTLVKQRPNDAQLEFVVGNVYDRMANPLDAEGKSLPKPANYEELIENAALHYKKAIEIDPKLVDAYYNLGVLYYNQSVEYYTRSTSNLKDAAKYNTMWEKPLPDAAKYLEKAKELNPKDLNTLKALKVCYGQMGDNDKYKAISDEIKALSGK